MRKQGQDRINRHVTIVMACAIGGMAVAWLNVPFYRLICKKLGISVAEAALVIKDPAVHPAQRSPAVPERYVLVRFMGVVNEGLPADFHPLQPALRVKVGENARMLWRFTNLTPKALEIQAVHNVVPVQAEPLLHKTQCFCFTKQTLQPRESKDLPVVFHLDPKLDQDIQALTLSYTLFNLHPENPELLPSEKKALEHQRRHAAT